MTEDIEAFEKKQEAFSSMKESIRDQIGSLRSVELKVESHLELDDIGIYEEAQDEMVASAPVENAEPHRQTEVPETDVAPVGEPDSHFSVDPSSGEVRF